MSNPYTLANERSLFNVYENFDEKIMKPKKADQGAANPTALTLGIWDSLQTLAFKKFRLSSRATTRHASYRDKYRHKE